MPGGQGDTIITGLFRLLGAMPMSDVTRILSQVESGDPSATKRLMRQASDERTKLVARKLAPKRSHPRIRCDGVVQRPRSRRFPLSVLYSAAFCAPTSTLRGVNAAGSVAGGYGGRSQSNLIAANRWRMSRRSQTCSR